MATYLGSASVDDYKLGSSQVDKVYLGTELLWAKVTFTPVTRSFASGSGTDTVPAGATSVRIEVWGGGGGGERVTKLATVGGKGGSAGGYARSIYACSGGQTLAYSVGSGGLGQLSGGKGGESSVTSGSLSITTMTGGGGGYAGGIPGSGSGGNQTNVTGGVGSTASSDLGGDGGAGVVGVDGSGYGHGGTGADATGVVMNGSPGESGRVIFYYT